MKRKPLLVTAGLLAVLLLAGTAGAIMTICTECYMTTLPWEPGPQGICLDLADWGYNFCFDGSPGEWCLHSNHECVGDEPTDIPQF